MSLASFATRRGAAALATVALIVSACGGGAGTSARPTTAGATGVTGASPSTAAGGSASAGTATSPGGSTGTGGGGVKKVAFVVSGNLGDKGFFDSAAAGIQRAQTELGIEQKVLQASPTDPGQWLQNLQSVSDGSYDIVIAGSTQMHDNMMQVAKEHPNQHYIMFDDEVKLPNVLSIQYKQNEGSYLAGVLAGLVTTDKTTFPLSKASKKVGLVGGIDLPVINDFKVGFEQGAKSVDPSIQVLVSYAGSFSDPNKGYNLTKAMYDQGADIVFAVAGGTGLGVLKASNDAKTYSIGVDSDQNGLYPGHVIASMVKRVDNSLFDSIKNAQGGTAQWGKLVFYGLDNSGVGLILDNQNVPQAVQDKLKAAQADVASGKVKVDTVFK